MPAEGKEEKTLIYGGRRHHNEWRWEGREVNSCYSTISPVEFSEIYQWRLKGVKSRACDKCEVIIHYRKKKLTEESDQQS